MQPYTIFLAATLLLASSAHATPPVTACAIRWDAWYTNGPYDAAAYTAAALSLPQFHDLAPLHGKFDANGSLRWAPSQASFDAEIRAAHRAGLCWAYLMYGENNAINLGNPMMQGLVLHRNSSLKRQVRYAIIVTTSLIGHDGAYADSAKAIVHLLTDSNYQQVNIGKVRRPVLFIYYDDGDLKRQFAGSLGNMKRALDAIRHACVLQGLGNPYVVMVLSPAETAEDIRLALGADAITEYVSGTRKGGVEQWAAFEQTIEADWTRYAAATAGAMVPTLRSGADIRARCTSPPPFEHRFPSGFDCAHFYVQTPTPQELKTEVRNATVWIKAHPDKDPAALMLLYAWSECDESGNCLMPTYGDPQGAKLRSIASGLK